MKTAVCLIPFVVLLEGCSFLFVQAPSLAREPDLPPTCTTSLAVPVLDVLLASGSAVGSVVLAPRESSSFLSFDEYAPLYLAHAAAFAGSAIYGLLQTSHCRDQVGEWRAARKHLPRDESIDPPLLLGPPLLPSVTATGSASAPVLCAEVFTSVQDPAHAESCRAPRRRPLKAARALQ